MKYTICNQCKSKLYVGDSAYTNGIDSFCSEDCLFDALGLSEYIVDDLDCEAEDAE